MKRSFSCFFTVLLLCVFCPVFANAQQSCLEGAEKCKPLEGKKNYDECIQKVCEIINGKEDSKKSGSDKDNKRVKGTDTCDNGLRRCDPIRNKAVLYWTCMEETCGDSYFSSVEPVCEVGLERCENYNKEYRSCMNLVCKNPKDKYKECDKGKEECALSSTKYWQCINRHCIAGVTQFLNPDKYDQITGKRKKNPYYMHPDGTMRKKRVNLNPQTIEGVAPAFQMPPPGVLPQDWVSGVPPERFISGSPRDLARCPYGTTMYCSSRDVLDCKCSDGSKPELLGNLKKNKTTKDSEFIIGP